VIPETLHWPIDPYLLGALVLALGLAIGITGLQIKRGSAERRRDRLYAERRRGEEPPPAAPQQAATVLEYLGAAVAFLGVVVLMLAWSSSAGQS